MIVIERVFFNLVDKPFYVDTWLDPDDKLFAIKMQEIPKSLHGAVEFEDRSDRDIKQGVVKFSSYGKLTRAVNSAIHEHQKEKVRGKKT